MKRGSYKREVKGVLIKSDGQVLQEDNTEVEER